MNKLVSDFCAFSCGFFFLCYFALSDFNVVFVVAVVVIVIDDVLYFFIFLCFVVISSKSVIFQERKCIQMEGVWAGIGSIRGIKIY